MVSPEAGARRPNFFIVGAARCGTTSMYLYLKQHPEIYVSVLKEPHFFGRDLTLPPQGIRDEEAYLGLFADACDETRLGEASVWYLSSATAAREIREFSPSAKIVIMLRDPVDMIRSLHSLYLRTGNEELPDLGEALAAMPDRREGRCLPDSAYFPEGLQYGQAARYRDKVARYLDVFGRDRVRVILFDDFSQRTAEVYRETLEFLEVDPTFEPELDLERATRKVREEALRQLRRVPPEIRAKMRGGGRNHTHPVRRTVDPELEARLRRDLAPDVAALSDLLGRDLRHWSRA